LTLVIAYFDRLGSVFSNSAPNNYNQLRSLSLRCRADHPKRSVKLCWLNPFIFSNLGPLGVKSYMDVFDLDGALVNDYERFARSFTQIRAQDIRTQVDALYASGRFWPEPLISINPHYEREASVQNLVTEGTLHPETARVFRIDGQPITLFRHQAQSVAKAAAGQSFVVTTGTGSGKSLCFFIPIIDSAIRARAAGESPRTRAIVIYPMNALANSQLKELEKFVEQSGLPDNLRPTFARYTGQEDDDERELIRKSKPDILLTNFMM